MHASLKENQAYMSEQLGVEKRYWMRITHKCNNFCRFCLDGDKSGFDHIPLETIKNEITRAFKEGNNRLIISGGEASIHPDFLKIVLFAKQIGFNKIQTISNGRMFSNETFITRARKAGLDEITFSLHGIDAETHDFLTSVKGSFKQCLQGIKHALSLGFIVSIDTTLTKKNINQLKEFIQWAISIGVREFDLLHMIPFGKAFQKDYDSLRIPPETYAYELQRALTNSYPESPYIWTSRIPAKYLENIEAFIEDPHKLTDELHGRIDEFNKILISGENFPCYDPTRCVDCALHNFCHHSLPLFKKWTTQTFQTLLVTPLSDTPNYQFLKKKIVQQNQKITTLYMDYYHTHPLKLTEHDIDITFIQQEIDHWSHWAQDIKLVLPFSFLTNHTLEKLFTLQDLHQQILIEIVIQNHDDFHRYEQNTLPKNTQITLELNNQTYELLKNQKHTHALYTKIDIPQLETLGSFDDTLSAVDWSLLKEFVSTSIDTPLPPCILETSPGNDIYINQHMFTETGTFNYQDYSLHFLAYYNTFRKSSCESCIYTHDCRGIHTTIARQVGLDVMIPVKNQ